MNDLDALPYPSWQNRMNNTGNFDVSTFNTTPIDTGSFDLSQKLQNIDLNGIASVAGVIGGFIANNDDKKYKREMLNMEKERIARAREKQDKFESDMKNAWS